MPRFLAFGDLHLEDCTDGLDRLSCILRHAREAQVDFIVSLGDLCFPTREHSPAMHMLNTCGIPVHHTIGNHDVQEWDVDEALRFLGKPRPYEAFIHGDYKLIILDTCYWQSGEGTFHFPNRLRIPSAYPVLPQEQLDWLEAELSDGMKTIICSHMSLVNPFARRGVHNKEAVQRVLRGKNVRLCMNGHDHGGDLRRVEGVPYYTVASASQCCWWGGDPPGSEVRNLFYRDPLHVIVDAGDEEIIITGMESEYVSLTPADVGLTDYRWNGVDVHPRTVSCTLKHPS